MQVALLPVYIREFRLTLLEASLIATIPGLTQLLMNIPSGLLADKINPKHLLSLSMVIEGFSALLLSTTGSFWALIFGFTLMKIASPIYHISGLSQLSRLVEREETSKSMGFHNALGNLGSAIGVISLALVLPTLGWRWAYAFWAIPILIWAFVTLRYLQIENWTSERREMSKRKLLPSVSLLFSREFSIFLGAVILVVAGIGTISTFMTTYLVNARGLSDATASLIFGLGPLMGMVASTSGGYVGERIGAKRALGLAIVGCVVSLSIMSISGQLNLVVFIYVLYSYFSNSIWVPLNTVVVDVTPRTVRGLSYSAFFFVENLALCITPAAIAAVIGMSDIWYIFPFSITFLVISLVTLQLVRKVQT